MYELTPEKITENYNKFESLCEKLGGRSEPIKKMLTDLGDRLALCPASGKIEFHSCFPGGLVDHSLRVLQNAYKLMKVYDLDFPKESIILSCLFHDLGKVGDMTQDYYVPQSSDWHKSKGMLYEHNSHLKYMSVPHRSIFLLQHYGVRLTHDETLAILLNDGQYVPENKAYAMREPYMSMIVHQADAFSTLWEKHNLVSNPSK